MLGLHHVGLAVSDLDAARRFYEGTASLEVLSERSICPDQSVQPVDSLVLKAPNGCLELMQFKETVPIDGLAVIGPGITHACFQAPAKDGLYEKFLQAQARPVSIGEPPIDLNGQGVRYAYARDPDGSMFEVEALDVPQFEGPIWLAHIALVTPDIDQAVLFYQDLLGVAPYGRVNKVMGPRFDEVTGIDGVRIRAAWFNTGNMILEFWQFIQPETPPTRVDRAFQEAGYNKFALEVGNLDAEVTRLAALGLCPDAPMAVGHGVKEVFFRDPDGNLFSLIETSEAAVMRVAELKQIDWLPSPARPVVNTG
ncbi:MAG: VOC family protein [Pseudomonadales bacterium]